MLRRIAFGMLWGLAGYVAGAVCGGWLVARLSSNTFDGEMEAVMTGAFVIGPVAGLAAFAFGAWRAGRSRQVAA